jgi:hypothetical protein
MVAPPPPLKASRRARFLVSGWLAIGAGVIAFLVRSMIRGDLEEAARRNPDAMLRVVSQPGGAEDLQRMMDWPLYIGIGLLALGVFYLARGFKEPPPR